MGVGVRGWRVKGWGMECGYRCKGCRYGIKVRSVHVGVRGWKEGVSV